MNIMQSVSSTHSVVILCFSVAVKTFSYISVPAQLFVFFGSNICVHDDLNMIRFGLKDVHLQCQTIHVCIFFFR